MLCKASFLSALLLWLGLAACFFSQRGAHGGVKSLNWQAAQTVNVELLVSEQDGALGQYDALFVVAGPGGKEWQVNRHTDGNNAVAFFPEDFHLATAPTGGYSWKCIVRGQLIVEGQFDYVQNNSVTTATADQLKIRFR